MCPSPWEFVLFCAYLVSWNGRPKYVGITSTGIERRWRTHKTKAAQGAKSALYDAIRSLGATALTIEWVASAASWDDLCLVEKMLIAQLDTYHAAGGWNLTLGGDGFHGGTMSRAARIRMSERLKGVKRDPAIGAKTGASLRGKPITPEHKSKAVAALQRHLATHGPHNKGSAMSEAQREKMRAAWQRRREKWPGGLSPKCVAGKAESARKHKAQWADPARAEINEARRKHLREVAPKDHSLASRLKMSASAKARSRRGKDGQGRAD